VKRTRRFAFETSVDKIMLLRFTASCGFVAQAAAHGYLLEMISGGQTICNPETSNVTCRSEPANLRMRATVPRVEFHPLGDPDCAVPPGCENGCPNETGLLAGFPFYSYCSSNHLFGCVACGFEIVATGKPEVAAGKDWTKWPAAHWGE
jgi:hypothetical protein